MTYLHLRRAGLDCSLTNHLPDEGIVLVHRECLVVDGASLLPSRRRLLINLTADHPLYPAANLQIVQNKLQAHWYDDCFYMPHWPEPGLIPRNENRGTRFETIAFVGNEKNLAPELSSSAWKARMTEMGLNWDIKAGEFQFDDARTYRIGGVWTDYGDVDAILAVRSFLPHRNAGGHGHKPPSKLINSWRAGLPAILGCESAFRQIRQGDLDYIEVHSVEETIQGLAALRSSELRQEMVANGRRRAAAFSSQSITRIWMDYLKAVAFPTYQAWVKMSASRQAAEIAYKRLNYQGRRLVKKAASLLR